MPHTRACCFWICSARPNQKRKAGRFASSEAKSSAHYGNLAGLVAVPSVSDLNSSLWIPLCFLLSLIRQG